MPLNVLLYRNVQATLGVPYWEAIVLTTVAVRLLVMPLVVVGVRCPNEHNIHMLQNA